ncbi:MAG: type II toxin-antitoxin system death-on-curing family toxin [Terriglobales bacterium]
MSSFLTIEEVVEINLDAVRKFGGVHGIRDHAALEGAIGRPRSGYYKDTIEEAAALFESLAQNHPFIDGNKRTAFTASAIFLAINGYVLTFNDAEAYAWLMGLFQKQQLNKINIDTWLRAHTSAA